MKGSLLRTKLFWAGILPTRPGRVPFPERTFTADGGGLRMQGGQDARWPVGAIWRRGTVRVGERPDGSGPGAGGSCRGRVLGGALLGESDPGAGGS